MTSIRQWRLRNCRDLHSDVNTCSIRIVDGGAEDLQALQEFISLGAVMGLFQLESGISDKA